MFHLLTYSSLTLSLTTRFFSPRQDVAHVCYQLITAAVCLHWELEEMWSQTTFSSARSHRRYHTKESLHTFCKYSKHCFLLRMQILTTESWTRGICMSPFHLAIFFDSVILWVLKQCFLTASINGARSIQNTEMRISKNNLSPSWCYLLSAPFASSHLFLINVPLLL